MARKAKLVMTGVKLRLRDRVAMAEARAAQLEKDYAATQQAYTEAITRAVRAERICDQLLSVMDSASREGKFPRN